LGGGELIALIVERDAPVVRGRRWRMAAALALVAAPLAVIVVGRAGVFLPLDPTVARLHGYIDEFASFFAMVRRQGMAFVGRYVLSWLLLLPVLLVLRDGKHRPRLVFVSIIALALTALGVWQIRWWLPASGPELCLLVVALANVGETWSTRVRWIVVAIIGAVFVEQSVARTLVTRKNVSDAAVTDADAMQPLFRDVAVALRHSQPVGPITLLSSPDASAAVSYFGGFRSIGTFYWENRDGLAAAAGMLSAQSDEEALARLRARGVTHIALFSAGNFLQAYLSAADRDAASADLRRTFGSRVLFQNHVPSWLRAIPFLQRPGSPSDRVLLFQLAPDQSAFDAIWAHGIALAAAGDDSSAIRSIDSAVAMAPPAQRAGLLGDAARETYRWRAHRVSLALFDASLALDHSPATALAVAWLLSTSPDDVVRNGARAVALMEPLARANPGAGGVLDTYAAALAESGRFDDAVRAESVALNNGRRAGDTAAVARAADRLRSYQAGRPWRQ
jgi:hypothetical protein